MRPLRVRARGQRVTWAGRGGALALIDEALTIAMDATRSEFSFWEQHAEEAHFADEFLC
jgi:hypothetical protein